MGKIPHRMQYRLYAQLLLIDLGEVCGDKNFTINSLLGENLFPVNTNKQTASVCEISFDTTNWCQVLNIKY